MYRFLRSIEKTKKQSYAARLSNDMVGELSPDGNFIWNGTDWEPIPSTEEVIQEQQDSNFLSANIQPQEIGWEAVSEKSDEGGKVKVIAMSIVGLLIASALGWLLYAFVIDPMLFPDELTRDEFVKMANDEPSLENITSGEVNYWSCIIELSVDDFQGEGLSLTGDYEIYVSKDSARVKSKMGISFAQFGNDIWIDENQIAWDIVDGDTGKIAIENLSNTPAQELLYDDDIPIDFCFAHHEIATSMSIDKSKSFVSEGERFPDEEGARAVKFETKQDIGEDGQFTVGVYFDGDGNMLGTKITNSSSEILVTFSSDSFSKPTWVKNADSDTPMPIEVEDSSIWGANHSTSISTLFNATYSMENAKVVLYTSGYDYDNDTQIINISHEVDIATAIAGGDIIQVTDDFYGEDNCTISYIDIEPLNEISTGDNISISCENYGMNDYNIGITNQNGLAQEVDLELPWISPFFTIIALLGAALIVSRREY